MKISAVISTWNKKDAVLANVAALKAGIRVPDEIVVVDNCSRDGTSAALRAAQSVLLLLAGETPVACSAAALTLQVAQRHVQVPRWALPPRPALELTVLRRRGAAGGGVLLLDLDAATIGAAPRID